MDKGRERKREAVTGSHLWGEPQGISQTGVTVKGSVEQSLKVTAGSHGGSNRGRPQGSSKGLNGVRGADLCPQRSLSVAGPGCFSPFRNPMKAKNIPLLDPGLCT